MPSSDSEDFESADEGRNSPNKKERKKRLSSSNYSDNLESEQETKQVSSKLPATKKQVRRNIYVKYKTQNQNKIGIQFKDKNIII